jgi:AraC-like DNA-binding protein
METLSPPTQSYRERLPRREAAPLLLCLWIQEVAAGGSRYEHRTVPSGSIEIACSLSTGLVRVIGPRTSPAAGWLEPAETVVGVRFRPGAAPALLGVRASELLDLEPDLQELWGTQAVEVGEAVASARSAAEAALQLEQAILARAAITPDPDRLVADAVARLQPWRTRQVKAVTSELFVSTRHLRRRFVTAVGHGPKALQRILRFQGFLALCDSFNTGGLPLARLAHLAGYADQAHLTRECSRLSGVTPTALLADLRHSCSPSHDHGASFADSRRALLSAHRR